MYSLSMYAQEPFKIISVTGAHSSVGKTTLCALLLNSLDNFGAIKFTKTEMFTSISEDPETILQKDKDTAIMSEAGAKKVVWIQSPYDGLEDALNMASLKMEGLNGMVVEGNSPVDFINPHLIIFIIGPDGQIKKSAKKVSKRADIIVINSGEKPDDLNSVVSEIKFNNEAEKAIFWIDLLNHTGEIVKFRTYVEKMLAKKLN
jgi:molybdopterin-guanine dinucleotide biosynthesis protein